MGKHKRNPDTPVPLRPRLKHQPETCKLAQTVAVEYLAQNDFDPQSVISRVQYNLLITKCRDGADIVAETPFMQYLFRHTYFKKGQLLNRRRRVVCEDEFSEALLSFPLHSDLSQLHESNNKRFVGLPALLVNLWHARLAKPEYAHLVAASRAAAAAQALKEAEREKMNERVVAEAAARSEAYRLESEGNGALPVSPQSIADVGQDASITPSIPVASPPTAFVSNPSPTKSVQETALEEHSPSSSPIDASTLDVSTPTVIADSTAPLACSIIA